MDHIVLSDNAARQLIDASTVFDEWRRVNAEAKKFAGGMYWKRQDAYEYLVRTQPSGSQKRIGRRTPENEAAYESFCARKAEVEERLRNLRSSLTEAQRQNRAIKVGRVPAMVIDVLNELDHAGVGRHFVVVGTHALYAYETAAGIRFVPATLATNDIDLLRDARDRIRFATDMERLDGTVLNILQKADRSFLRDELHPETAINDRGFKVDFLKREPEHGDPHPFSFTSHEGELYPVQARRASILTNARRFNQMVVGVTGRMALMHTIDPTVFVSFKQWMARAAPDRDSFKRRRDARQAAAVQALLDEGLLSSASTHADTLPADDDSQASI